MLPKLQQERCWGCIFIYFKVPVHMHTQAQTYTSTDIHKHRHTQAQPYTNTAIHRHKQIQTDTYPQTDTDRHIPTNRYRYTSSNGTSKHTNW